MIKIWGTEASRALRPIWTAEEMGLDYELTMMPFPPRVFMKEYLDVNMLGTIPYLIDGDVKMTESVAENEPDCFYYEMHETDDPLTIMMIELYQTEEAHANHAQTDHFETLGMALAPFLDGAPDITVHKSVN